jgi:hypothetical protein
MFIQPESDPLGQAIYNYSFYNDNTPVSVLSKVVEDEFLPPDYFFRTQREMPHLEKIALKKCSGRILDIGAGAGCHSIILQKMKMDVTALEISQLCCKVLGKRGIKKFINDDIFAYDGHRYNTLLLLMNGIGIAKNLAGIEVLLEHLKKLLLPKGSILLDSTDLIYLFQQENGSIVYNINSNHYYGEIEYQLKYKNIVGETYSWIFADNVILLEIAEKLGYQLKIIDYGPHYDYLAELTLM